MENRKFAPCLVCIDEGDEQDKEIHAHGMCVKHYRAFRRKQGRERLDEMGIHERESARILKAHQYVAQKCQKFLYDLNHDNFRLVFTGELIQALRDIINPALMRSHSLATPVMFVEGTSSLENSEGKLPLEDEGTREQKDVREHVPSNGHDDKSKQGTSSLKKGEGTVPAIPRVEVQRIPVPSGADPKGAL